MLGTAPVVGTVVISYQYYMNVANRLSRLARSVITKGNLEDADKRSLLEIIKELEKQGLSEEKLGVLEKVKVRNFNCDILNFVKLIALVLVCSSDYTKNGNQEFQVSNYITSGGKNQGGSLNLEGLGISTVGNILKLNSGDLNRLESLSSEKSSNEVKASEPKPTTSNANNSSTETPSEQQTDNTQTVEQNTSSTSSEENSDGEKASEPKSTTSNANNSSTEDSAKRIYNKYNFMFGPKVDLKEIFSDMFDELLKVTGGEFLDKNQFLSDNELLLVITDSRGIEYALRGLIDKIYLHLIDKLDGLPTEITYVKDQILDIRTSTITAQKNGAILVDKLIGSNRKIKGSSDSSTALFVRCHKKIKEFMMNVKYFKWNCHLNWPEIYNDELIKEMEEKHKKEERRHISIGQDTYDFVESLGEGAQASVGKYKKQDGTEVALKFFKNPLDLSVEREALASQELGNISKAEKYFVIPKKVKDGVFELPLAKMDMLAKVKEIQNKRETKNLTRKTLKSTLRRAKHVLKAVSLLNERNLYHRDVALRNLLFFKDTQTDSKDSQNSKPKSRIKLSDFGLLRVDFTEDLFDVSETLLDLLLISEEVTHRDGFPYYSVHDLACAFEDLKLDKIEDLDIENRTYYSFELNKKYGGAKKEDVITYLNICKKLACEKFEFNASDALGKIKELEDKIKSTESN